MECEGVLWQDHNKVVVCIVTYWLTVTSLGETGQTRMVEMRLEGQQLIDAVRPLAMWLLIALILEKEDQKQDTKSAAAADVCRSY